MKKINNASRRLACAISFSIPYFIYRMFGGNFDRGFDLGVTTFFAVLFVIIAFMFITFVINNDDKSTTNCTGPK